MYLCCSRVCLLRKCNGERMRTALKSVLLFLLALGAMGCQSPSGEVGDHCRNRSECKEGLKCGDNTCYDPNAIKAPASGDTMPSTKDAMVTCAKSRECRTHGRCSASVAGGCIPTLPSHCERATVGCKKRKRCTFVPEQNECCTDETGVDCNLKLGDRVRLKKEKKESPKP